MSQALAYICDLVSYVLHISFRRIRSDQVDSHHKHTSNPIMAGLWYLRTLILYFRHENWEKWAKSVSAPYTLFTRTHALTHSLYSYHSNDFSNMEINMCIILEQKSRCCCCTRTHSTQTYMNAFYLNSKIPSVDMKNEKYLPTHSHIHTRAILIVTKFLLRCHFYSMISIFRENFNTFKSINFCFFGLNSFSSFLLCQPTLFRHNSPSSSDSEAPRRNSKSLLLFAASFYTLPSILISLIDCIT